LLAQFFTDWSNFATTVSQEMQVRYRPGDRENVERIEQKWERPRLVKRIDKCLDWGWLLGLTVGSTSRLKHRPVFWEYSGTVSGLPSSCGGKPEMGLQNDAADTEVTL
jgi:hypothetical protein